MAISKIKLGSANAVELRDDASLHYIGHLTSGITNGASAAVITTDKVTDYTVKENDFLTYGTENLNYACTAIASTGDTPVTWTLISEATAADALLNISINGVNGAVDNHHIASVTIYAKDVVEISDGETTATADNTLPAGILTGTPTADGELANKKYVDDATVLAGHMKFIGTVGTGGDVATLPLTPATAAVGDTYKVFVDGTYDIDDASTPTEIEAKVGDLFICKVSDTEATPSVEYSYVPSGDDVDVTSVDVSAGLSTTLPSGQQGSAITTTGTINLKLVGGATPLSGTVTAASGTYRTLPVGVDTTNGNLATAVPAGTLTEVLSGSDVSDAITAIENTGNDGTGAGAFLAAHVGDPLETPTESADTLYLDYITPTTIENAVTYTAPTP